MVGLRFGAGLRCSVLMLALLLVIGCGGAPASRLSAQPTVASSVGPTATAAPTPLPTLTPVPTSVPGGLYVDATRTLGAISPWSYGSNIGPWTTIPLDTRDDVAAAGLTFMRFPGGNWGDENDLRDTQIDEYLALCREFAFEPSISVRLLGSTPEQAAAVVRYTNVMKQYKVRYWSIGNEPSLYAAARQVPDYDTVRYNREWRAFAEAMRVVDPSIVLVGPDIHQWDASGGVKDPHGRFWMREFLLANGDMVDIVAFHRYPFPKQINDPAPPLSELYNNSREWDELIPALRALIRETTGRDLPVAVTEVNSNWTGAARGETTPDSFASALWWSDVLGRLIRQRVEIVAHFAIYGPGRQGWGLVEKFKVRPAYHVYRMYQQFGNELIYASSDQVDVGIYAARRSDGVLTLMIVNLRTTPHTTTLTLDNATPFQQAETWRFDRTHPAEQVAPTPLKAQTVIRLPAESVILLIVPSQ